MKNKTEPSLEELKKEIEQLKRTKERKLKIATSMTERNKLLSEINELNVIKKSPNALRNFGKTFGKGLGMVGRTFWKGVSRASRNLNKNAPEFKEFSKTMNSQPRKITKTKKMKRKKVNKKARRMVYNQSNEEVPSWGLP